MALIDFDFAAPGRRTFDLAAFARMCVPVDDEVSAAKLRDPGFAKMSDEMGGMERFDRRRRW